MKTEYASIQADAAAAYADVTGPADAKDLAETALEDLAYPLARACRNHFKKTGDATREAQVRMSKYAIQRLREQALATTATLIRDLATEALAHPDAGLRKITAARVAALTAAITAFTDLYGAPRGQIVNRTTKIRDIETRTANLMVMIRDPRRPRHPVRRHPRRPRLHRRLAPSPHIIDAGHGPGEEEPPVPPVA